MVTNLFVSIVYLCVTGTSLYYMYMAVTGCKNLTNSSMFSVIGYGHYQTIAGSFSLQHWMSLGSSLLACSPFTAAKNRTYDVVLAFRSMLSLQLLSDLGQHPVQQDVHRDGPQPGQLGLSFLLLAQHRPLPGTSTERSASPVQDLPLSSELPHHLQEGDQEGGEGHAGRHTSRVACTLGSAPPHSVHHQLLYCKYALLP